MAPPQTIGGQRIREAGAAPPAKEDQNHDVREQEMDREPNPVERLLKALGPGLVTGASDDDPPGIGTYSAAGASMGYSNRCSRVVSHHRRGPGCATPRVDHADRQQPKSHGQ